VEGSSIILVWDSTKNFLLKDKTRRNKSQSILLAFQGVFEIGAPRIDLRGVKVSGKLVQVLISFLPLSFPFPLFFYYHLTHLYNIEYDFVLPVTNDPQIQTEKSCYPCYSYVIAERAILPK
jgi:hypothetical protein